MALIFKLLFLTVFLAWSRKSMAMAPRPLDPSSSLAARLQSDSSLKCWDSLLELQACTGEVILFFLNGETYLGPGCCQAIRTIEHQCWPAMLGSLGFTPEESNVLQGYCDATETPPSMATTKLIPSEDLVP